MVSTYKAKPRVIVGRKATPACRNACLHEAFRRRQGLRRAGTGSGGRNQILVSYLQLKAKSDLWWICHCKFPGYPGYRSKMNFSGPVVYIDTGPFLGHSLQSREDGLDVNFKILFILSRF
jgi:hypothetical protein